MKAAGGAISLLVGAVLLRLTVTGTSRRYVRVEMGRGSRSPGSWWSCSGSSRSSGRCVTIVSPTRTVTNHGETVSGGCCWPRSPRCCSSPRRRSAATASTGRPRRRPRRGARLRPAPRGRSARSDVPPRVRPASVRPRRRELQRHLGPAHRLRGRSRRRWLPPGAVPDRVLRGRRRAGRGPRGRGPRAASPPATSGSPSRVGSKARAATSRCSPPAACPRSLRRRNPSSRRAGQGSAVSSASRAPSSERSLRP